MTCGGKYKSLAKYKLPATLSSVDELWSEIILAIANNVGEINRRDSFRLQLLLREALNNAIIHGCGNDPNKTVECILRFNNGYITICIMDPGAGFDWRSRMTPVTNPLNESGRGIPIMMANSTRIEYNRKGNHLLLEQKLVRRHDNE